jgi:hypothetical protein
MLRIFDFGKFIYEKCNHVLKNKACEVFPLVAENGTNYPFCIYHRTGFNNAPLSKDLFVQTIEYEISIVSDKYEESIQLITLLYDFFNSGFFKYDKNLKTEINDSSEDYNQAFIQTITIIDSA